jgi:hypothetical protein
MLLRNISLPSSGSKTTSIKKLASWRLLLCWVFVSTLKIEANIFLGKKNSPRFSNYTALEARRFWPSETPCWEPHIPQWWHNIPTLQTDALVIPTVTRVPPGQYTDAFLASCPFCSRAIGRVGLWSHPSLTARSVSRAVTRHNRSQIFPLSPTSVTCVIVFYTAVGLTHLSALLLCLFRFLHPPSSVLLFTVSGGQFLSLKHSSFV